MINKESPRVIAFYLPQFYPTPENNEWWEPGFTEWTNVTRSKPLFYRHYQPRLPEELSFYDLRVPEIREQQAELATYAGIEGFCYWHYWFAGRRLLDRVFSEVVESGKPDFPFCLCWANHHWFAKTWDPSSPDKLLIEQTYPGQEDIENHFYALLSAFKDERYMKMDGKLIFGIYQPHLIADYFEKFKKTWNQLAAENGLPGFCFFGFVQQEKVLSNFDVESYDFIVRDTIHDGYDNSCLSFATKIKRSILFKLQKAYAVDYSVYVEKSMNIFSHNEGLVPCIAPDFDHSPRSGWRGIIYKNSTPSLFEKLCRGVAKLVSQRTKPLLFIKAWNEWGEGNYMEPDQRWGRGYIEAAHNAFKSLK